MTPERFQRISAVLKRRQPDLTVITDEVHKGRNLSAIIRSCDAVGVDRVHCVAPEKGFRPYRGTSLGTHKWVEVMLHETVEQPVEQLKTQGFQVVAAHLSDSAVDYRQIDYTRPTALLMGAEREGVSLRASQQATRHIVIPMLGMVESLNVSVACAVILLEAQRQRQLAGMYNTQRLCGDEYQRRFFQWAHPHIAEYCDQRRLPYPPVREDGELQDGSAWYRQIRAADASAGD
jgi:tRNA (guanosine-2'-O-)-methyltransferase